MSLEDQLKPHREAIDHLDAKMVQWINERAEHAQAIGHLKGSAAVYRPEREAEVLRRIQALNQGPLSDETMARLFQYFET
jgi:chorismate mutase/prephenate dehydratase